MNFDLQRCLKRHPEAVLCADFVVAAVASYDNATHEIVGYRVSKLGLEYGGLLGYLNTELFTEHDRACRKVVELGKVTLRNDLLGARKKCLLLKAAVENPADGREEKYVERDRVQLQLTEELIKRMEDELAKLED